MKVKVWCNGHGWIWAATKEKIYFTKSKECATEYGAFSDELLKLRIRIEHTIMCNYDLIG